MVTRNKNSENHTQLLGNSKDIKPTNVEINSIFTELDTKQNFYWTGLNWELVGGNSNNSNSNNNDGNGNSGNENNLNLEVIDCTNNVTLNNPTWIKYLSVKKYGKVVTLSLVAEINIYGYETCLINDLPPCDCDIIENDYVGMVWTKGVPYWESNMDSPYPAYYSTSSWIFIDTQGSLFLVAGDSQDTGKLRAFTLTYLTSE